MEAHNQLDRLDSDSIRIARSYEASLLAHECDAYFDGYGRARARADGKWSPEQCTAIFEEWGRERFHFSARLRAWARDCGAMVATRASAALAKRASARARFLAEGFALEAQILAQEEEDMSSAARHADLAAVSKGPCVLTRRGTAIGQFSSRRDACIFLASSYEVSHLSRANYLCEFEDGSWYDPSDLVDLIRAAGTAQMIERNNPRLNY